MTSPRLARATAATARGGAVDLALRLAERATAAGLRPRMRADRLRTDGRTGVRLSGPARRDGRGLRCSRRPDCARGLFSVPAVAGAGCSGLVAAFCGSGSSACASAIDRCDRRFCFRRTGFASGGEFGEASCESLSAFSSQIPAMAFGGMLDAVIPMAAFRRLVLWPGKTIRRRRCAICVASEMPASRLAKIADTNFAVRLDMCSSGDDTRYASRPASLRKDLGRNEPQFRKPQGLIRARFESREANKWLFREAGAAAKGGVTRSRARR